MFNFQLIHGENHVEGAEFPLKNRTKQRVQEILSERRKD